MNLLSRIRVLTVFVLLLSGTGQAVDAGPEVTRGLRGQHRVALTFDAGGEADCFTDLIRALASARVASTFFITGKWAYENPECAREIARHGHEIGNHTWHHLDLTRESNATVREEIQRTEIFLTDLCGQNPRPRFRAPYGARDARVLRLAQALGYRSIYWTLDSLDSVGPPPEVEESFPSGTAYEELVHAATQAKARLLVVGAIGRGLARRLLVGSVAERVAEASPVPTLVVRPGGKLDAWISGERPLQVLAGYDFSNTGDAALGWLPALREIGPCDVHIAHIDWPPEVAHRFGHQGPLELSANPAQMQNFLERDLREHIALHLPAESVSLTVVPGWGRTDAHLLQIAAERAADLVVVGTHRRHGLGRLRFGSVSRGILHHAQVSVAVVPATSMDRGQSAVPRLNRVLVATDFSDLGNEAVRYACALLQPGGELTLVHVSEANEENPKLLAQLRALLPASAAHRFEIEPAIVQSGNASEAIAQAAERFDADVICLGSHGRSGLAKTFLGSVAQGVMTGSRRPVLVVRERAL